MGKIGDYTRLHWRNIVIFILIIFCLLCMKYGCKRDTVPPDVIVKSDTTVIYHRDTVFYDKIVIPPKKIDTFIVFKESRDTLFVQALVKDTLWMDSLLLDLHSRDTIIRDSVFITYTKRSKFALGIGAYLVPNFQKDSKTGIGAQLDFRFQDRHNAHVGYDFINRSVMVGYSFNVVDIRKK